MEIIIQVLCAVAVVSAVLYAVPRIEVIPATLRMIIIVVTVLCAVLWVLRYAVPRVA
jgi:hypothetical protein